MLTAEVCLIADDGVGTWRATTVEMGRQGVRAADGTGARRHQFIG